MRPCRFPAAENAEDEDAPLRPEGLSGELNDTEGTRRCGTAKDGEDGDGGVLPRDIEGPLRCP